MGRDVSPQSMRADYDPLGQGQKAWERMRRNHVEGHPSAEAEFLVSTPEGAYEYLVEMQQDYGFPKSEISKMKRHVDPIMNSMGSARGATDMETYELEMGDRVKAYDAMGRHAAYLSDNAPSNGASMEMGGFFVAVANEANQIEMELQGVLPENQAGNLLESIRPAVVVNKMSTASARIENNTAQYADESKRLDVSLKVKEAAAVSLENKTKSPPRKVLTKNDQR
jgi:hypothetical protein